MACYRVRLPATTKLDMINDFHASQGRKPIPDITPKGRMWAKEIIPERVTFICGKDLDITMCSVPGCDFEADYLCDEPMGGGKTCDMPVCEAHAEYIGQDLACDDLHLCPTHRARHTGPPVSTHRGLRLVK